MTIVSDKKRVKQKTKFNTNFCLPKYNGKYMCKEKKNAKT